MKPFSDTKLPFNGANAARSKSVRRINVIFLIEVRSLAASANMHSYQRMNMFIVGQNYTQKNTDGALWDTLDVRSIPT